MTVRGVAAAIVAPFALALYAAAPDPPPPASRLTFRVPRFLRVLPFGTFHLVQVADTLLAAILFASTVNLLAGWFGSSPARFDAPHPLLLAYAAAAGCALPLVLRHRGPLAAWRLAAALLPLVLWVTATARDTPRDAPYPVTAILMYLLVLYSAAARAPGGASLGIWVITVLTAWIVHPGSGPLVAVVTGGVVLFGHNVRARRLATARLVEEERRTRQAEGAQMVLEERARIARELHDVVAHHLSVIAIQAEAVPMQASGDPAVLEAGLGGIRRLSLEAIAELRQVLGVLRDQHGRTDTAPQPGLDRLDELVAHARSAGLSVRVGRSGALEGLPPAVSLSAYRIVQESLSNAMRHAPGSDVAVGIARDARSVRLRVVNGPGSRSGSGPGAGHGLVGMRERVALLGGALDAGPLPRGGFEVHAVLPVQGSAGGSAGSAASAGSAEERESA
ncbi:Signal transduction histidine kinase [Nonomuraea pusilla]|uniref:histidine kinase n=1 Tax=Nonomuraea pusilla TaxID=46177 RepID=A0A1H7XQV7_9ACTN|nr:Signal transduction histidine kinase [Nonomuraea pusilla]